MKKAIELLQQQKAIVEGHLEKPKDEAEAQSLTLELADLELAIAILQPVHNATTIELERWRNGYAGIRNLCVERGHDLT